MIFRYLHSYLTIYYCLAIIYSYVIGKKPNRFARINFIYTEIVVVQ